MDEGFIYVLINPSLKDMVKVGKTHRDPEERASELSQPTGVPTPFILVYKQFFEDCSKAERRIHQLLESKGYRVAPNREFFMGPVHEIIDVIKQSQYSFSGYHGAGGTEQLGREGTDIEEFREELCDLGDNYYYGYGDTIQDEDEAFKIYTQAAKLGSGRAYRGLAIMTWFGDGAKEDHKQAMEYLKKGATLGDYFCYGQMGKFYLTTYYKHPENAMKCWRHFFKCLSWDKGNYEEVTFISSYIEDCLANNISVEFSEEIRHYGDEILKSLERQRKRWMEDDGEIPKRILSKVNSAIKFVNKLTGRSKVGLWTRLWEY